MSEKKIPLWKQRQLLKEAQQAEREKREKEAKDEKLKELLATKDSPGLVQKDYFTRIATLHARGSRWVDDDTKHNKNAVQSKGNVEAKPAVAEELSEPAPPIPQSMEAPPAVPADASGNGADDDDDDDMVVRRGNAAAAPKAPAIPTSEAPPIPSMDAPPAIPFTFGDEDIDHSLPPADASENGLIAPNAPAKPASIVKQSSARFTCGYADTRGMRRTMEDRISVVGSFLDDDADYFGIFDGHGGKDVANHAADFMHALLYDKLKEYDNSPTPVPDNVAKNALSRTFLELQDEIEMSEPPMMGGATAIVTLIHHNRVFVANAGDARIVYGTEAGAARRLTHDHKPGNPDEKERIEKEGGFVTAVTLKSGEQLFRVCGAIAVSRALGDVGLQPFLVATPFVGEPFDLETEGADKSAFMILACDGLWDVISDEEAVSIALQASDPEKAAVALRNKAYKEGSTDNISVLVIDLRRK